MITAPLTLLTDVFWKKAFKCSDSLSVQSASVFSFLPSVCTAANNDHAVIELQWQQVGVWWCNWYSVGLANKRQRVRLTARHHCPITSRKLFAPVYSHLCAPSPGSNGLMQWRPTAGKLSAGRADSNNSLPLGLSVISPVGWLLSSIKQCDHWHRTESLICEIVEGGIPFPP